MPSYKLVVVGGGGVGKSALTLQFVHSKFVEEYEPTIENFYQKQVEIDEETCMLEIIDTAGQEEFALMRDTYYRSGDGFLVVYSVDTRDSFDEVTTFKEHILKTKQSDTAPIVIVGNKKDLVQRRKVSSDELKDLASLFQCAFIETSAKTRENVDMAFFQCVREIRKFKALNNSIDNDSHPKRKKKKKNCFII
ncbi:ras-like protein rasd [Anaeramoeba ignava]|uniref:Ras-like protein rasd n=1 Tax=Anaeramoeba ignava TaxID=1746090 RepID=A0A9Q0LSM1_ANAIG|nr:ras-like protein rasd [Anaeramoeba ignava]